MSLPESVKATIVPSMNEKLVFVAKLEQMPGVTGSGDSPDAALAELRKAVDAIQRRVGGGPVEIIEPPVVGYQWQAFLGGSELFTQRFQFPFSVEEGEVTPPSLQEELSF